MFVEQFKDLRAKCGDILKRQFCIGDIDVPDVVFAAASTVSLRVNHVCPVMRTGAYSNMNNQVCNWSVYSISWLFIHANTDVDHASMPSDENIFTREAHNSQEQVKRFESLWDWQLHCLGHRKSSLSAERTKSYNSIDIFLLHWLFILGVIQGSRGWHVLQDLVCIEIKTSIIQFRPHMVVLSPLVFCFDPLKLHWGSCDIQVIFK